MSDARKNGGGLALATAIAAVGAAFLLSRKASAASASPEPQDSTQPLPTSPAAAAMTSMVQVDSPKVRTTREQQMTASALRQDLAQRDQQAKAEARKTEAREKQAVDDLARLMAPVFEHMARLADLSDALSSDKRFRVTGSTGFGGGKDPLDKRTDTWFVAVHTDGSGRMTPYTAKQVLAEARIAGGAFRKLQRRGESQSSYREWASNVEKRLVFPILFLRDYEIPAIDALVRSAEKKKPAKLAKVAAGATKEVAKNARALLRALQDLSQKASDTEDELRREQNLKAIAPYINAYNAAAAGALVVVSAGFALVGGIFAGPALVGLLGEIAGPIAGGALSSTLASGFHEYASSGGDMKKAAQAMCAKLGGDLKGEARARAREEVVKLAMNGVDGLGDVDSGAAVGDASRMAGFRYLNTSRGPYLTQRYVPPPWAWEGVFGGHPAGSGPLAAPRPPFVGASDLGPRFIRPRPIPVIGAEPGTVILRRRRGR